MLDARYINGARVREVDALIIVTPAEGSCLLNAETGMRSRKVMVPLNVPSMEIHR